MRETIKKLLIAGAVAVMVFAFAGCGGSNTDKSTTEATSASTSETTETTTASADDYDIMSGFELQEYGSELLLYGNDFLLIMPNDDDWGYEKLSPTSLEIYLKDAREDGLDGHLVTIMAFDPDDTSYEDFPEYAVAGHGPNCGKTFIALFPTDVQYNMEDEDQAEDYEELSTHVHKIAEGMANSPFQTADSNPQ